MKPDCAVLNITEEQPDIVRFPPPFEGRYVTVDDARSGGIKLEQVWQPIWDTFRFPAQGQVDTILFFQNPAGRSRHETNMQSSGQFFWPKQYYPVELVIRLGTPGAEGFVKEFRDSLNRAAEGLADNAQIEFRIGEKIEFCCPLWGMYNPSPREWRASLLSRPHIPAVQNFLITLSIKSWSLPPRTAVRCLMNGYLLREIQ